MSLDAYAQSLCDQFLGNYRAINLDYRSDEKSKSINIQITPELNIAMNNIIKNAISFAYNEILVLAEATDKEYFIKIRDDGPGFDFDNLPDPTDPKNIEKPHGRGVFLMRNLADNIEFDKDGAVVIMSFNLENELLQQVQKEKEEEV